MQTTLIVFVIIFGLIIILYYVAKAKMKNIPMVSDHENIINITENNFNQYTKGNIVLVDFWAGWCAPCKMMAPILNDVANDLNGNYKVGKVDIEKFQSLANKFKVRSIPTLILLKDGKEINRFVGVKQKDFLIKEINKVK